MAETRPLAEMWTEVATGLVLGDRGAPWLVDRQDIERRLARLRADYTDTYMLHLFMEAERHATVPRP